MINIEELQSAIATIEMLINDIGYNYSSNKLEEIHKLLIKQEEYLEELSKRCIIWGVNDFISQAEQRWEFTKTGFGDIYKDAAKWQDVYDETKFENALKEMIRKHDANNGIIWDTINFYLDEYCLKK